MKKNEYSAEKMEDPLEKEEDLVEKRKISKEVLGRMGVFNFPIQVSIRDL